jgi:hypothetical protein
MRLRLRPRWRCARDGSAPAVYPLHPTPPQPNPTHPPNPFSAQVRACAGALLTIRSLHVRNDGWQFDQLSDSVLKSASCPEVLRIRGYTLRKNGGRTIAVTQPGAWLVEDGVLSLDEDGGAAGDGGGRRSSVGGAIFGEVPPPPNGTWSSSSLSLAPGSTMRVPLVLGAPSRVTLEVEPPRAQPATRGVQPATLGVQSLSPSPSPSPYPSSRWSRAGEGCTSRCCPRWDLPCYHPPTCHPRPRCRQTAARAVAARVAMLAAAAAAVAAVRREAAR